MKTSKKIAATFGLTQEEMAAVLNIGRAHWSMYETGKRSLPLAGMSMLGRMVNHMDLPAVLAKRSAGMEFTGKKRRNILEQRLRANEFEQLKLARKIDNLEKKRESEMRRAQIIEFLSTHNAQKTAERVRFVPPKSKTRKSRPVDFEKLSIEYELQKEVLAFEEKLIENKLKAITL